MLPGRQDFLVNVGGGRVVGWKTAREVEDRRGSRTSGGGSVRDASWHRGWPWSGCYSTIFSFLCLLHRNLFVSVLPFRSSYCSCLFLSHHEFKALVMINYRRRGLDVTADGRDREMMTTVTITRGTDMPVHLVPVIRRFVILLISM